MDRWGLMYQTTMGMPVDLSSLTAMHLPFSASVAQMLGAA